MVGRILRSGRTGNREACADDVWARRGFLATAGFLLVTLLGACSPSRELGVAEEIYKGIPSGAPPHTPPSYFAMVLPDNKLVLTNYGSSSCVSVPVDLRLVTETEIEVDIKGPDEEHCTADIAPASRVIALDQRGIDGATLRTVVLVYLSTGNRTEIDVFHGGQDD